VATAEVKTVLPEANPHGHARGARDHRTVLTRPGAAAPEGIS
jgi:hypothetical protein